jgi:purine-binding chemotaxis protein CheW
VSSKNSRNQYVVFYLDGHKYALHLACVERVLLAVEVSPLPGAPGIVLGVINVQGRIIPVVNIRRRFGLRERDIDPADRLIMARTARRPVALLADEVAGVLERAREEIVPASDLVPGAGHIQGVLKLEDGLILIHDLDRFLSLDEEKALDRALEKKQEGHEEETV